MSIGSVLALLRDDFPDITISKIRFLESEGLITPERAPSGYRRFSEDDCERLRFVLTAQRDRYLPLKVIKEQLDAIDSGDRGAAPGATRLLSSARGAVAPATDFGSRGGRVSRESLIERTGVDAAFVTELQRNGLLSAGPAGFFDEDAVRLVEAAAAFAFDVLTPGGTFVAKVLAGGAELSLQTLLKQNFDKVANVKPPASRADSSEKFVVAQGFRGKPAPRDAGEDDV